MFDVYDDKRRKIGSYTSEDAARRTAHRVGGSYTKREAKDGDLTEQPQEPVKPAEEPEDVSPRKLGGQHAESTEAPLPAEEPAGREAKRKR